MAGVLLKNEETVEEAVVHGTMAKLRDLEGTNPIALYELVMKCRDEKHKLHDREVVETLIGEKLANPGGSADDIIILDSIRGIVLSAVEGDGLKMTIGSPLASS